MRMVIRRRSRLHTAEDQPQRNVATSPPVAVPELDPPARQVVRRELQEPPVIWRDLEVVLVDLPPLCASTWWPFSNSTVKHGAAQAFDDPALDVDNLPVPRHRASYRLLLTSRAPMPSNSTEAARPDSWTPVRPAPAPAWSVGYAKAPRWKWPSTSRNVPSTGGTSPTNSRRPAIRTPPRVPGGRTPRQQVTSAWPCPARIWTDASPRAGWDAMGDNFFRAARRAAGRSAHLSAGLFAGISGLNSTATLVHRQDTHHQHPDGIPAHGNGVAYLRHDIPPALWPRARRSGRPRRRLRVSGVTAGLLAYDPHNSLPEVRGALVWLTARVPGLPRWATPPERLVSAPARRFYPYGKVDCGLGHGVPGPLSALALALLEGHELPGQSAAVRDMPTGCWSIAATMTGASTGRPPPAVGRQAHACAGTG